MSDAKIPVTTVKIQRATYTLSADRVRQALVEYLSEKDVFINADQAAIVFTADGGALVETEYPI